MERVLDQLDSLGLARSAGISLDFVEQLPVTLQKSQWRAAGFRTLIYQLLAELAHDQAYLQTVHLARKQAAASKRQADLKRGKRQKSNRAKLSLPNLQREVLKALVSIEKEHRKPFVSRSHSLCQLLFGGVDLSFLLHFQGIAPSKYLATATLCWTLLDLLCSAVQTNRMLYKATGQQLIEEEKSQSALPSKDVAQQETVSKLQLGHGAHLVTARVWDELGCLLHPSSSVVEDDHVLLLATASSVLAEASPITPLFRREQFTLEQLALLEDVRLTFHDNYLHRRAIFIKRAGLTLDSICRQYDPAHNGDQAAAPTRTELLCAVADSFASQSRCPQVDLAEVFCYDSLVVRFLLAPKKVDSQSRMKALVVNIKVPDRGGRFNSCQKSMPAFSDRVRVHQNKRRNKQHLKPKKQKNPQPKSQNQNPKPKRKHIRS
jgi:hypothetical protein